MSEFEKQKSSVVNQLRGLCAHCANDVEHTCRIQRLVTEVSTLSGVPLIVNDRFKGLLMPASLTPQRILAGMN
jgi:hypothetical protein